uniref:Uncharacterized protein n=1 Tax=Panagrolaimus sp. PS1159 TaxID=55785 RepID=A0AC35GIY0_9BILA
MNPKSDEKLIAVFSYIPTNNNEFFVLDATFSVKQYLDRSKAAFQGYVAFEDINNRCPLEALSQPLFIHDEKEIIHIRSTYYENEERKRPCKWQFKTYPYYGFKIVIELFPSTQLTIENSTQVLVIKDMAQSLFPYYNIDNYIQISLSNSTFPYAPPGFEFEAYVSVVRKKYKRVQANCTTSNITLVGVATWQLDGGYQNNAYCVYEYVILPNHQLFIQGGATEEKQACHPTSTMCSNFYQTMKQF